MLKNYLQDSLPYQIQRKFHRLRFIDKPIFILGAENLGISNFNYEWISKVKKHIREYEQTIYSEENFKRPDFQIERTEEILLGFYDPGIKFLTEKEVSIEHIFISFYQIGNGQFKKIINDLSLNNDLIITVEPGIDQHNISDPNVLKNVINGKYDNILEEFYSILASAEKKIYLRFAHEMEIPITRYAWQSKDPVLYINAFRYFMEYPKGDLEYIKKVWGPAGDRGSLEWYPGNDVVDYVSIAIYGLPDKNITDPEKQETFYKILSRKMYRFRFLNKPFFITEFGVMGDEEFQTKWLTEAAIAIRNTPRIRGVSYFNETDVPKAWGDIQPPDWSISKNTYRKFVEILYQ
jgi:beta-mannanase